MIGSATKAKYIIIDDFNVVVFSACMTHANVANAIGGEVTGAGFVEFVSTDDLEVRAVVSGASISLGIGPSPLDEGLIGRAFGIGRYTGGSN
jgi:hypothetical protein